METFNCDHCGAIVSDSNPNHYSCWLCEGGKYEGKSITPEEVPALLEKLRKELN